MVAMGALSEAAREIVGSGCAYVSTTIKEELKERNVEDTNDDAITEAAKRAGRSLEEEIELSRSILERPNTTRSRLFRLKDSGVLTDAEYDELYACGSEHKKQVKDKESYRALVRRTPHKLRATITELWLKRLVQVATRRGHLTLPNANNLQIKIAQLPNLYTTVFNIANVPIPFNYMQYLQFLLAAYMLLYTFVIVPNSGLYTPIWVFLWGTFLFMADEVAMEIECPFGLDANDIDLEARLLQIEEELTVLIRSQYYFVTGGASLSHIPENFDDGSWRQVPYAKLQSKPGITEAFSFHQGRLSPSNIAMVQQESLPEISEFTTLIQDPANTDEKKENSGYGSTDAVA
ncbi:unnamed protein product [Phytophthora fragariaefolia]|uniref:Unnamed protein product n=1 Tax=Phytophthora fragariaefolia TaxID=1490495 RepID=A0A9W6TYK6_9STRA|nr:unnamed protein product [Phytophthora fragariaefolia]